MPLTKIDDRGLTTPIDLLDNEKVRLGTGSDLEIYHNGTNSYITNDTGGLNIAGTDVGFTNVGSTEWTVLARSNAEVELYYDGSKKLETTSQGVYIFGNLEFNDGDAIKLGNSDDFQIFHSGTASRLFNNTGQIQLESDSSIVLGKTNLSESYLKAHPDGAVQLYYDNSQKFETYQYGVNISGTAKIESGGNFHGHDNVKFIAGTSEDLQIFHDGSNSRIAEAGTGYLIHTSNGAGVLVQDYASGNNMAKFLNAGAVELYHNYNKKFETTSTGATVTSATNECIFRIRSENQDGAPVLQFISDNGDDNEDLWRLRADGGATAFAIQNYASGSWESNIVCRENGNVELRYDNVKTFETASHGNTLSGSQQNLEGVVKFDNTTNSGMDMRWEPSSNSLDFIDNVKARFGTGNDLQIYHDGTHSHLKDASSGELLLSGSVISLNSANSQEYMLKGTENGAVALYYDNATKLATEATGVAIEGKMHSGHDMPTVGQTSFHTVDQAIIGTKHVLTAYHNSTSTSNSPLALNSVIPTNSAGEITIIAGWSNGNGLRIRKFAYVASGNTSVTEIYNHFNSRYGVSVSISTPTPSISGDYVNFSIGFSDSQGAKVEKLKVHVEYFKQFNI